MMGGDITVESELGRGSTFTIRLPRIVEASEGSGGHRSGPHRQGGAEASLNLLHCICRLMALFVESLQCRNSGAIVGTTDMPRIRRAYQSDVNDPGCVKTLRGIITPAILGSM